MVRKQYELKTGLASVHFTGWDGLLFAIVRRAIRDTHRGDVAARAWLEQDAPGVLSQLADIDPRTTRAIVARSLPSVQPTARAA